MQERATESVRIRKGWGSVTGWGSGWDRDWCSGSVPGWDLGSGSGRGPGWDLGSGSGRGSGWDRVR
ncbi:MAG: hypothetical protein ACR2LD_06665, partial [Actinomycetota bacterium]